MRQWLRTYASLIAYFHEEATARDVLFLRAALLQIDPEARDFELAKTGAKAVFPVKAKDLPGFSGPALGEHLRKLENRWISSDFTLSKTELLA